MSIELNKSDDGDSDSNTPPWNFSWVVANKLAAMAWPQTASNVRFIYEQGVRHLVTLSPEKRPPVHNCTLLVEGKLKWTEIAVEEFEPPTLAQIEQFIKLCRMAWDNCECVGIHCRMGRGRTGVMAACYLVHFYDQPPERAIINVRLMRPGSVETHYQERAVKHYHDHLRRINPSL